MYEGIWRISLGWLGQVSHQILYIIYSD